MPLISIQIDHFATLRELKHLREPDPSHAAVIAELAGVDGVCCHLREDRRAIRDRDLYILKEVVKTKLNVQIAPTDDLMERVIEVKPWMVTLMPLTEDNPSIQTGIDLEHNRDMYAERAASLKNAGLNVSYFIDPEIDAVKHAAKARADAVALNAFKYISAESIEGAEAELDRIEQIAQLASKLNLMVYCGNGLNYRNIRPVVELGIIDEFVVGYAVICRATLVGLERAVREIVDKVHHPVTKT